MKSIHKYFKIIGALALILAGYILVSNVSPQNITEPADSIPIQMTLSGSYVCLPYLDKMRAQSEECIFGLQTDDNVYYMVNFGSSESAMEDFRAGKHITAKGFVVLKEALSTDHWAPYDMKGIFTITERL